MTAPVTHLFRGVRRFVIAARQRTLGLYEHKPAGINIKVVKANWTQIGAHRILSSWLRLSTSQHAIPDVIASQNDDMAMGARRVFEEITDPYKQGLWLSKPFLGVDGVSKSGQAWVRSKLLKATIVVPPNTQPAIEMLSNALRTGIVPPQNTLTVPQSFPPVCELSNQLAHVAALGL